MSKTALLAAGAYAAGKAKEAKSATENTGTKYTSLKEATLNKPLVWLTIIGIGGYLLYRAGSSIASKLNLGNADKDIKEAEKTGQTPSYPSATYSQLADKIEAAVFYTWGTDLPAIYDVFNLMKNNLDVAMLIKAFGKRRLEWSLNEMVELGAHLSNDLDSSEIAKVNSILASKGITYRF